MERDIVDIVMEKTYLELSAEERSELAEFCSSEDEFNQLKHVFASVENMEMDPPVPRAETKERLDHLFAETYPKTAPVWYNSVFAVLVPKDKPLYRQPLLHIAAVALLLIFTVPLMQNNLSDKSPLMAEADTASEGVVSDDASQMNPSEVVIENNANAADDGEAVMPTSEISLEQNAQLNNGGGMASSSDGWVAAETIDLAPAAVSSGTFMFSSQRPESTHPDGVFIGGNADANVSYSLPASETSDLLDLLTTTF